MNDNKQRDELARLANGGLRNGVTVDDFRKQRLGNNSIGEYIADAILAAGYRKPRTVTTVEELDALPVESVVRSYIGTVWEKGEYPEDPEFPFWCSPGEFREYPAARISLPATVLHEPEAEATR